MTVCPARPSDCRMAARSPLNGSGSPMGKRATLSTRPAAFSRFRSCTECTSRRHACARAGRISARRTVTSGRTTSIVECRMMNTGRPRACSRSISRWNAASRKKPKLNWITTASTPAAQISRNSSSSGSSQPCTQQRRTKLSSGRSVSATRQANTCSRAASMPPASDCAYAAMPQRLFQLETIPISGRRKPAPAGERRTAATAARVRCATRSQVYCDSTRSRPASDRRARSPAGAANTSRSTRTSERGSGSAQTESNTGRWVLA